MRRALLPAACVLALAACAGDGLLGPVFQPDVYTVRPGDTVYSIAWRYQVDPQALIRWNDLRTPDNIQPGQRLRLRPGSARRAGGEAPAARRDTGQRAPARTAAPGSPGDDSGVPADATRDRGAAEAASGSARGGPGEWRWPTAGEVIGSFTDGRVAGRGLDIGGEHGQPVQATAAGEVVYSGRGLQAYGRLVIIRHDAEYLSAYAHNSNLLVQEGERVTAGQQIARMGRSNAGRALLHFEIRRQGKPVDPMDYLPPRP